MISGTYQGPSLSFFAVCGASPVVGAGMTSVVCRDVYSGQSFQSDHRHVCISTTLWHCLHLTKQHQWNLQLHLSVISTSSVWNPRPQHISSQPSMALDVLLHCRPLVPKTPFFKSWSQKSGLESKYTRSSSVCGLNWEFLGTKTLVVPIFFCSTSVAPSNFSFRTFPTLRNGGMAFQQVFTSHDPETPWHLHSTRMLLRMAYKKSGRSFIDPHPQKIHAFEQLRNTVSYLIWDVITFMEYWTKWANIFGLKGFTLLFFWKVNEKSYQEITLENVSK